MGPPVLNAIRLVIWVGLVQVSANLTNAAEIKGTVRDLSGAPADNTSVELRREGSAALLRSLTTDRSGTFQFTELEEGVYKLSFHCVGFRPLNWTVSVRPDQKLVLSDVALQLAPIENCPDEFDLPRLLVEKTNGPSELVGIVEESGSSVRNAAVTFFDSSHSYRTTTGVGGHFRFTDLDPGRYTLRIRHADFADFLIEDVDIRAGKKTLIGDVLQLDRCPTTVHCNPTRKVRRAAVCM